MSEYNEGEMIDDEQMHDDYHGRCSPGDVEIPNRVFVKGFSKEASEEELKSFFEIYGIVHDAKIVYDKCGLSKGYAFISFDRQEIAEKVKEMGKVSCRGREIVIGPAKIRKRKPVSWPRGCFGMQPANNAPVYYSPDNLWYYHIPPMLTPPPSPIYATNEVGYDSQKRNAFQGVDVKVQAGFQHFPWVVAPNEIITHPPTTTILETSNQTPTSHQPANSSTMSSSGLPPPQQLDSSVTSPPSTPGGNMTAAPQIPCVALNSPPLKLSKPPKKTPPPPLTFHPNAVTFQPNVTSPHVTSPPTVFKQQATHQVVPASPTQQTAPVGDVNMTTQPASNHNTVAAQPQMPITGQYAAPFNMVEMRTTLPPVLNQQQQQQQQQPTVQLVNQQQTTQQVVPASPTQQTAPVEDVAMTTQPAANNNTVAAQPQMTITGQQSYAAPFNLVEMRTTLPPVLNQQQQQQPTIQLVNQSQAMQPTMINNATPHMVYSSAPMQCVPIQYDNRYIEGTVESLHTNVLYYDPTKMYPNVFNELPQQ